MDVKLDQEVAKRGLSYPVATRVLTVNGDPDLPPHSTPISAEPHGISLWATPTKITVKLANGSTKSYFLKIAMGDPGHKMLQGEYEGVKAIHDIVPEFVPRPIAWGKYKSAEATYFFLADFIPMVQDVQKPEAFCEMLARLHKKSTEKSPNGKWGFHVVTCGGTMPQEVTWCDTWEESYTRALRGFVDQERAARDPNEELDQLYPELFNKVIPRLLRPLSAGDTKIEPVLVHGDLWCGNMATNAETAAPVIFDAAAWWAHNEYELHTFDIPRYRIGREFMDKYHELVPKSDPVDEYEDRHLLYSLHAQLCASTLRADKTVECREALIRDAKYLVNKYASDDSGETS